MVGAKFITVKNINYTYAEGSFRLENVSIEIENGKAVALLGPNGSGKTTLTKIILGILKPSPPHVYINGKNIFELPDRERARLIAWVPQEIEKSTPLKVRDFILLGRLPHTSPISQPSSYDYAKVDEAIELFELKDVKDLYYSQLSGGQKRMVAIARSYAQGSDFIVMDEPTAYLDFRNKTIVLKIIKKLAAMGKGILFTTHDPNEAYQVADSVILLDRGKIVAMGPPHEILEKDILEKVYRIGIKIYENGTTRTIVPDI